MPYSRRSPIRFFRRWLPIRSLKCGLAAAAVFASVVWWFGANCSASLASRWIAQQGVATVSAASFEPLVAPDSIATAFGSRLATQTALATPGQPLPLSLGGTTVEINRRAASLFFVTPTQIGFLIPPETELGVVSVNVRAGDGTLSTGTVRVAAVAPGVFTANSSGRGIPAATLLRVKPDGKQFGELLFVRDALKNELATIKVNPGPEGERLFLILFLTGLRGAPDPNRDGNSNESVRVSLGGVESQPLYAGRQGDFAGLDQINIELPRNLAGRGTLNIAVNVTNPIGVTLSNTVQIEMAATATDSTPPTANPGSIVTPEDVAKSFTLSGSAAAGQSPGFIITSPPSNGQLSGNAPNLTYTPKRDFNGTDPFTFRVRTETAFSEEQTVTMIVQPVNDPPTLIVPGPQIVNLGERLSFIISATNPDAGELLSFKLLDDSGKPPGATITREPGDTSARFNWTPPAESVGKTYVATFRVSDPLPDELSDTKTVTITTGTLWAKTSGPEGGVVNALLTAGGNLFAGTASGGIFRSPDQGNNWAAANNGLGDFAVNAVFAAGGILLAGTEGGIYLSLNQGQNWMATNIRDSRVFDFAANGNNLFAATDSSVRISTDGGRTWTNTNNNDLFFEIAGTVLAKAGLVFVASNDFGPGLYVTSNNGRNWTPVRGGLPSNGEAGVVSLAATVTHLFAVTTNFRATTVYASADNGQSWTIANAGLPSNVRKLFANGSTAYALADNAIFASTNNGQSWAQINATFTARGVRALSFAADKLLAGTGGDGVLASTDGGRSFVAANQGFTNSSVTAFALNDDRGKLYVATNRGVAFTTNNGTSYGVANSSLPGGQTARALAALGAELFAANSAGVFISLGPDRGWQAVNNGLPNSGATSLAALGSRLFAGTSAGVFVTANQGQSWTPVNSGLANLSVSALAFDGARLLAGTGDGVFAFNDQTQSWSRIGSLSFPVRVLAASGKFIVASGSTGVKVTEDGGTKWRDVIEGLTQSPSALAIRGTTAYGGLSLGSFGDGIFALSTGADKWAAVNESLTNLAVNALIVNDDKLFAGTNDGVSLSASTDQSWKNSVGELASLDVNALLLRSTDLPSGTELFAAGSSGNVFRSVNQGQTWETLRLPAANENNVTALCTTGGAMLAGTNGNGVYRSFDRGGNWTNSSAGLNNRVVRAFAESGVFLFTATESGVYRSGNQGQNWERMTIGLPGLEVTSLLSNGDAVFAGLHGDGVFVSNNGGQNWSVSRAGMGNFNVRSLGRYNSTLFAGTDDGGLYRSTDGGRNWAITGTDLPGVSSFAASGNRLYAGGVYGVYVSTDQGVTWRQINAGLTKPAVNALAVIGNRLFAGTSNGGVFISQIPE